MNKKMVEKIKKELSKDIISEDYFDISITYIQGYNNSDIICAIIQTYGEDNIHFVNYDALFADYTGEKVVVFNNFDSSVPLGYMVGLLDDFPAVPTRDWFSSFCSRRIFVISDIPLPEQYPDYDHEYNFITPTHWEVFLKSFDNALVCQDDFVHLYSKENYLEYLRRMERQEEEQNRKKELEEAIKKYNPETHLSYYNSMTKILHLYNQLFGLRLQNAVGYEGRKLSYDARYQAVDRAGNVVIDDVKMEYLGGLLQHMGLLY